LTWLSHDRSFYFDNVTIQVRQSSLESDQGFAQGYRHVHPEIVAIARKHIMGQRHDAETYMACFAFIRMFIRGMFKLDVMAIWRTTLKIKIHLDIDKYGFVAAADRTGTRDEFAFAMAFFTVCSELLNKARPDTACLCLQESSDYFNIDIDIYI
jgi:hypothetical protein